MVAMKRERAGRVLLAAFLVVLAVAAAAFAAVTPKPGIWAIGSGESGGSMKISGHTIAAGATSLSDFKCNKLNAVMPSKITIDASGTFSYSGKLKGQPGSIAFSGRFTSASKATGKSVIRNKSCKRTISWVAKPYVAPTAPAAVPPAY